MFEEQSTQAKSVHPKKRSKKIGFVIIVIAVIAALGIGGYFTYNYVQEKNAEIERLSDPQQAAKDEATKIKELVANLVEVPADENPTIATVNDASKLKSQAFFAKSQNGDKVLIFTKAKKAYLYRPSTNKVIEVAPINIGKQQTKPQSK